MSFIPSNELDGPNLIAQFIIEYRGRGHFLPYDDHQLIKKWISLAGSVDALLLILSDMVPEFFKASSTLGKHPPSLSRLDKRVCKMLEAKALHQVASPHRVV